MFIPFNMGPPQLNNHGVYKSGVNINWWLWGPFSLRGLESHASLSMLRDLNGRLQLLLQYDAKVIDGWAEEVPMISYVY